MPASGRPEPFDLAVIALHATVRPTSASRRDGQFQPGRMHGHVTIAALDTERRRVVGVVPRLVRRFELADT